MRNQKYLTEEIKLCRFREKVMRRCGDVTKKTLNIYLKEL